MPPQAGAVLLDLYFLRSAGHLDLGAIIQIARFGALKPDHFATFFCHDEQPNYLPGPRRVRFSGPFISRGPLKRTLRFYLDCYAKILVTTPEPTVLPPSRTAKRSFSSMAIGAWSSTSIVTLSPGITISAPPSSFATPVTSVVRK